MRLPILFTAVVVGAPISARAISPQEVEFFEKKVRPVLSEHCYSCHGPDKQKAELRLDSRAAILKGSDIGPVVVPGKPDESSLIQSVRHEGDSKMPEKEDKLSDDKIAALTEWIRMGMPWPEGDAPARSSKEEAAAKHWAFQPIRKPEIPGVRDDNHWGQTPLDRFVLAKLEAAGVTPTPKADRRTLIRRATFDLTGLPPTLAEIEAFEKDTAQDAFAKVVDRLLASPRYGERWGRHWLDVARYADSKGYVFQEERRYPYSYTYRDWVIQALNNDLPYDQFLVQQLAADQVSVTREDPRPLAAMGFLTLGRRFLNNQHDIIDDRIDLISRGLMGLTVACARCHDHKFDPIPQKDYYALYGVFASSVEPKELPLLPDSRDAETRAEYEREYAPLQRKVDEYLEKKRAEKSLGLSAVTRALVILPSEITDRFIDRDERNKLRDLRNKVEALNASPSAPPRAMVLNDAPKATDPHVFLRGNPGRPGDKVPRRFLTVLSGDNPQPFKNGSGRLELAQAIASKDNPLTARVMVNRVWMHHFGQGLVRTPGDFGVKGEAPTHPELLDWLASGFIEEGWSLKKLHRTIMLSSAYQQDSVASEKALKADPENRLISRMNRRRLDFESMRDSLLSVAGQLDFTMGGKAVEITRPPFTKRRTIYGFIDRQNLPGTFRTFDFASPDTTSPQRYSTTVPQQALFMMNSPFVIELARSLANKPAVGADQAPGEWQIQAFYEQVFARRADPMEIEAGLRFINTQLSQRAQTDDETPVWQYGYGSFDDATNRVEFTRFNHFTKVEWHVGPKVPDPKFGYLLLRADTGHTGRTPQQSPIRRWTAPRDAVISIAGVIDRPSEHGDGVIGRIVSSRSGQLAKYTVPAKGKVETRLDRIEVKQGEQIDFIVECGESDNSDSFSWAPLIQSDMGEWDAKIAFAGPPPSRPAPLKAWEKYAQVLLSTNEFVFVD